jgi:hypothetical protein
MSSYSGKESDSYGLSGNNVNNLFELQNGRVTNIVSSKCDSTMADYDLFDTSIPVACKDDYTYEFVRNIHTTNLLSTVYFSDANMQLLQNQIRYAVFKASEGKYIIGPQSEKELSILRRSLYLQNGRYLPPEVMSIQEQVRILNNLVINYSVARIMSEIQQYTHYIYDVENMYVPIEHPVDMGHAGSRTLKSVTTTF